MQNQVKKGCSNERSQNSLNTNKIIKPMKISIDLNSKTKKTAESNFPSITSSNKSLRNLKDDGQLKLSNFNQNISIKYSAKKDGSPSSSVQRIPVSTSNKNALNKISYEETKSINSVIFKPLIPQKKQILKKNENMVKKPIGKVIKLNLDPSAEMNLKSHSKSSSKKNTETFKVQDHKLVFNNSFTNKNLVCFNSKKVIQNKSNSIDERKKQTKSSIDKKNLILTTKSQKNIFFKKERSLDTKILSPQSVVFDKETIEEKLLLDVNFKLENSMNSENSIVNENPPLDISKEIKNYENVLTAYEINEILSLKEIYFLGLIAKRSQSNDNESKTSASSSTNNNGFDDEECYYIAHVGDHINYRYEIIEELGTGTFGKGIKCIDHKNGTTVCVKIIRNKENFTNQAEIEISILEYINEIDIKNESNIAKMIDNFVFRSHVCIVFEILGINLYTYLKNNNFKPLPEEKIRSISKDILKTLKFLRKHSIIHCDLKPENILFTSNELKSVKVIDLGSACFESDRIYTYIQSRFYRAPEILLKMSYGVEIDMWSFGCILSELYKGMPIFPGNDEDEQLKLIILSIGYPSPKLVEMGKKSISQYQGMNAPANSKEITNKLINWFGNNNPLLFDLIKLCLEWDMIKRINPDNAENHPWINNKSTITPSISMNRVLLSDSKELSKSKTLKKTLFPNKINSNDENIKKVSNNSKRINGEVNKNYSEKKISFRHKNV